MPRLLSVYLILFCFPVLVMAQTLSADLVLHNARIYTVNPAQPTAEALAVADGKIVGVGTSEALLAAYPDAERVDAKGHAVIPGLIDAHVHLMSLGISMLQADLVGATSKSETLERLQAFEATLPDEAWLTGRGWDQNDWAEKAFPDRYDLDALFPDRPVWLRRIDGHAAWANSAAIKVVGEEFVRALPDPEGGKIMRDVRGEPTGIFVDAAMDLIDDKVPAPTDEQYAQALQLAIEACSKHGLTGVHEAGVGLKQVNLYRQAIDADQFNLRLYGMIGGAGRTLDHFCENGHLLDYGDKLTVRSVKLYMDGALGSRGAALLADYSDEPGNQGLLMRSPEDIQAVVTRAMQCKLQVNTHAIGDRGNRVVLDAYETAIAETGFQDGRHRVEHAQIVALEDIPRFAEMDVVASVQPTHATSDMYWAEDRVGPKRIQGAYAWRKLLNAGARLALGSDFPVERVNPMLGFYAAITRQDAEAWPEEGWYPEERLTRAEALRGFTLDAAWAAFQEDQLGSLERGKWADFVILSHNIMTVPPAEVLQTSVVATYLGGRRIYGPSE